LLLRLPLSLPLCLSFRSEAEESAVVVVVVVAVVFVVVFVGGSGGLQPSEKAAAKAATALPKAGAKPEGRSDQNHCPGFCFCLFLKNRQKTLSSPQKSHLQQNKRNKPK
jgi:hypothetical protein